MAKVKILRISAIFAGSWLLVALPGHAGVLKVHNESGTGMMCKTETASYPVPAHGRAAIPAPVGDIVCGKLAVRMLNLTQSSPDRFLDLNGRQTRVLNVALYPYLPNPPGHTFDALVQMIVRRYQERNPAVLLSVQMGEAPDIYDFDAVKSLLGADGLDVIEVDTSLLKYLVSEKLITPVSRLPNPPLNFAREASSLDGKLWGVPSWVCTEFVFSADPGIYSVTNLNALTTYLSNVPPGDVQLASDYDGVWRLPALYIDAFVQQYGPDRIDEAFKLPLDVAVVGNLKTLIGMCRDTRGGNPCIDGTYNGTPVAAAERAFAHGGAAAVMDYSEQAFYIRQYGKKSPLHAVPAVWGRRALPLFYVDSLVNSRQRCANSPCRDDAAALAAMLTGVPMKTAIVTGADIGGRQRPLLPATRAFYDQPQIRENPLYRDFSAALARGAPFPNRFTPEVRNALGHAVCRALKAEWPQYACETD